MTHTIFAAGSVPPGPVRKSLTRGQRRRGSALFMTIMLTMVLAALAMTAIYSASNAGLLSNSFDREREFKYAAEAAIGIGKSRLNNDALALPDTGYAILMADAPLTGADGEPLPGVTVNLYVGQTGSTSGQFGRFASVVAEAKDERGARFVRRLELAQESFAKYAYWSNDEGNVVFGANDNLWGPVWSNDDITVHSTRATFHGAVGTAGVIYGAGYGTFVKGYSINERPISLPGTAALDRLQGYAAAGNFSFNAPTSGDETSVVMRIEFVAIDMNGDGDSTDVDEGFVKFYTGVPGSANWVRGDWNGTKSNAGNCGAAYPVTPGGPRKFFPASVHNTAWFQALLIAGGMTPAQALDTSAASLRTIMSKATARCYLGGEPQLVSVERNSGAFAADDREKGGDDTTFTASGARGSWAEWPGAVDPRLLNTRYASQAAYLFPIDRGLNPGTKGVIYVDGTVGISGVVRGRITVYATRIVTLLDDLRYASDPSSANPSNFRCADILGVISGRNFVLSNNAILGPPDIEPNGSVDVFRNQDDTKDVYLHAVVMAIDRSFTAQAFSQGPSNANDCEGTNNGRGCLYLTGGIIQQTRGAVGLTSGQGYVKRYSYDHCAAANPPPYFPTTGRFTDNRYYELDPVRFDVTQTFNALRPN